MEGVGNLAHFEHKRTLLTLIIPYFHLTSGAYAAAGGGVKPDQGAKPPDFNHLVHIKYI